MKKKNHSFHHWLYRGIQLIPVIQFHPSGWEMRHLASFLHIFQQGNVRQNTPMNLQLIHVRSVTHQSAQVTNYSFQCTNSNGWAQPLVHPPFCREDLFPIWHLLTHTLLHLLCAQTTLGIGFFLFKVQLLPWEPEWSVQFYLSRTAAVTFFGKHLPLTYHYPSVQKISCYLVISFPSTYLYTSLPYNLKRNACETGKHSHSYTQWNCILLKNRTGTTICFPNGQMQVTQTGNKQAQS